MDNWEKVYENQQSAKAELAHNALLNHEIQAVIINKKDSSFPQLGRFEIFVPAESVTIAKQIIENEITH